MSTVLLADAALGPIFIVGGVLIAAGVAAAVGVVLLGLWLVRRGRRTTPPRE